MKNRIGSVLLRGVGVIALLQSAHGQAAEAAAGSQSEPGTAIADAAEQKTAEAAHIEDIVVTGSRLVRDGTQAPTPLTVVSVEAMASTAPAGIAEGLNQLPIFQGSINAAQTQVVQANRVRSGNYLNLRNLGPQRLLVLWDGNRLPPSGNNGGVDTNIIPQMLIERVEVVTGGASAAYGSDAVSGVVNYIIDKRFRGIKTLAQTGISDYDDAVSYRLGVASGTALLDDRLTLLASAEYYSNDGVPHRSSRPGGAERWSTGAVDPTLASGQPGTAGNPFLDYRDTLIARASRGGLIVGGPAGLRNQQFLPDGQLAPFNPGTPIGRPGFAQGGDGIDSCVPCTLVPSVATTQLFGRAAYDLTPEMNLFVQASYNHDENESENLTFLNVATTPIFNNNFYLRQQLTPAQLGVLGAQNLTLARTDLSDWSVPGAKRGQVPSEQTMESIVVTTGLSGSLFSDWKWEAIYTYGKTDFESVAADGRTDRYLAAVDAVAGPNGQPVCNITLTHPGRQAGCLPLNVLGFGRGDQAAIDWILDDSRWDSVNTMHLGAFNVTGSLFSTPAGPVSVALGAEIRRQKLQQTSNSDPAVLADFTGIRGVPANPPGQFFFVNVGQANGAYTIKEIYGETVVPLLKDRPFADSLELNGALRYTDYSTSGGVQTYKLGTTWSPIPDIRLRGTYSRDIRAPSLFEAFAGETRTFSQVPDPVFGVVPVTTIGGGNPDLKPEKSHTYTIGVVLEPSFLSGFYFSADYFNIKINDAIATPGNALAIFQACASHPESFFCGLINRDATGFPISVRSVNENVAVLRNEGIDFEIGYRRELAGGDFSARSMATRLISYARQESELTQLVEYAGSADLPGFLSSTYPLPKWRGSLELTYSKGPISVGVQERYIGEYEKSFQQFWAENDVPDVFYTDISLSADVPSFGGSLRFTATVNNLFNKEGPFFVTDQNPGSQLPTARAVYDIIGRYFTLGVRGRF